MTALAARPAHSRPAGQAQQTLALIHHRLMLVMLLFLGATAIVAGRLAWLHLDADIDGGRAASLVLPARADIVDRNGVTLARTFDAWSIGVRPREIIGDRALLARRLAELIPGRGADWYRRRLSPDANFRYLSRRALPETVAAVNALGEPGIVFAREPERLYPQTELAAHVLGWTDFDGRGVAGIERAMEQRLTAPESRGEPLMLSIDGRVQAAMESALSDAVAKHRAKGGTGIVLDVDSGELLALASFPNFNPNAAGRSRADAQYNRATMGVYELGSTFKPLTVAAAIEAGVAGSLSRRYDATAPLAIGRFRISDDHPQKRWLNVPETLVHSSNIVTARIADAMGAKRMQAAFRGLGFDAPPAIELPEKSGTLWPDYWSRATVMTSGYGHGIAVTPLHLASGYAALVNGGILRPPTVLKLSPGDIPEGRRVYSERTSRTMRQLLRLIVLEGTGRRGDAPGFRVGGKTGTAEKTSGGGYSRRTNVSTFAAAFPMDDPRYVVVAMLDAPKGTADTHGLTTAAWTAAPVVRKVIERSGPLLGVIPEESRDIDVAGLRSLLWKPRG
ncbi:MAG: peptidoglycan D,D-transpeptidase FtsI family protein [Sphingomonadaceae bacterium]